jgi:hypothetical protein
LEIVGTAEYYRMRAAEMRRLAETAPSASIRQSYLIIAADWDKLASGLEAGMPPPAPGLGQHPKL